MSDLFLYKYFCLCQKDCWIFVNIDMKLMCFRWNNHKKTNPNKCYASVECCIDHAFKSECSKSGTTLASRLECLNIIFILGCVERREDYGGVLCKYVAGKRASFCKVAIIWSCFISVVHFASNGLCLGFHVSTETWFPPDTFS
jgi:hypothetical protein